MASPGNSGPPLIRSLASHHVVKASTSFFASLRERKLWFTGICKRTDWYNLCLCQMVSAQTCPRGWTFHGRRCYSLSTEHKVTWNAANRACRERYAWSLDTFCILNEENMIIHASNRISPSVSFYTSYPHVFLFPDTKAL